MSILNRILSVFVVAAIILGFAVQPVRAQSTPTDEQLTRITNNCLQIKNTLNQLHASDALLRVNRGQVYESMGSKLMNNFNIRLSSNRLDAKAPSAVTDSYREALDTFRVDYRDYEQKLSQAIRTDCSKDPYAFHNVIEEARELRGVVHEDVQKLHRFIDDYRNAVGDFLLNYERVSE